MTAHPVVTNDVDMRASPTPPRRIRVDDADWRVPILVDHMIAMCSQWRRSAEAVTDAYERWCATPVAEGTIRFAAYLAALDQEQAAAGMYAESITKLEHWLVDSHPNRGVPPHPAPDRAHRASGA